MRLFSSMGEYTLLLWGCFQVWGSTFLWLMIVLGEYALLVLGCFPVWENTLFGFEVVFRYGIVPFFGFRILSGLGGYALWLKIIFKDSQLCFSVCSYFQGWRFKVISRMGKNIFWRLFLVWERMFWSKIVFKYMRVCCFVLRLFSSIFRVCFIGLRLFPRVGEYALFLASFQRWAICLWVSSYCKDVKICIFDWDNFKYVRRIIIMTSFIANRWVWQSQSSPRGLFTIFKQTRL